MRIRNARSVISLLVAVAPFALLGACDGAECGEGTMDSDGTCVPDITGCGTGTVLMDGECIPESMVVCGDGSELVDGACRPSATACAAGTTYDMGTRECVPDTSVVCGPGTTVDTDGTCVVDTSTICGAGTSYDMASGECVPDVTCRMDQVPLGGFCVSQTEVDRSMADVTEASPDMNDPAYGGTPEALTLPSMVGDSTIFAGAIDDPADLDMDMVADQDVDVWQFTAAAGDVVQVSIRNLGALQLGFRVEGPSGFSRMGPLYVEPEPSRYLYLPYDGDYTIVVAPQTWIDGATGVGPAGSTTDEQYVGVLSNVGPISPTTLAVDTPTNGIFPDIRDQLFEIEVAMDEYRGIQVDPVGADVTPVYLIFDGAGAFLREETDLTTSPLVHRAAAANDLRVLVDYSRLVGLENDFQITSVDLTPTDLGILDTATPTVTTTVNIPAGGLELYTATPVADTVIEIEATAGTGEVITVSDASGPLTSGSGLLRAYRATADPITIQLTNGDTAADDFELTLTSYAVTDLGSYDVTTMTSGGATHGSLAPQTSAYFKATSTVPLLYTFQTSQTSSVDLDLFVYDTSFTELASSATSADDETADVTVATPGLTLVRVFNDFSFTTGNDVAVGVTTDTPPVAEVEPNDTATTAQPLALDTTLTGSITSGDTDFIRVTLGSALTATELLHVRVDADPSGDDWTCRLWDSTATTMLQEQTPREDGCVLYVDALAAGDYLVELVKAGTTARDYSLRASVIPGVLESEPNDTAGTANMVDPFAVPVYGEVPLDTDEDNFDFTVPASSSLLFVDAEAVGTNSTGTMDIDLAGPGGEMDFDSIGTSTGGQVSFVSPTAGTWTATLTRTSTTATFSGWYRFTARTVGAATAETEPNDTPATANTLALGAAVTGVITAPTTGDDDYFALTLGSALAPTEELVVRLYRTGASPTSSLRVTVFDTDGTTSLDTDSTGDPREIRLSSLAAGTYYLRADSTFDTTLDTDYLVTASIE